MTAPREARLRAQFADLYPGIEPGAWYSAAWLSARQLARNQCDGVASSIAQVLDERHFEFRGGRPRRLDRSAAGEPESSARASSNDPDASG
jgi:hypothetical protein